MHTFTCCSKEIMDTDFATKQNRRFSVSPNSCSGKLKNALNFATQNFFYILNRFNNNNIRQECVSVLIQAAKRS